MGMMGRDDRSPAFERRAAARGVPSTDEVGKWRGEDDLGLGVDMAQMSLSVC